MHEIEQSARVFVTSVNGQLSPLAEVIDAIVKSASKQFIQEAKVTLMGVKSGESRAEQAVMSALAEDDLSKSPLLGLASAAFPKLARKLVKHPEVLEFVLSKFGGRAGVAATPVEAGGDYAARLNKYDGGG